jgi:hypothetical protein
MAVLGSVRGMLQSERGKRRGEKGGVALNISERYPRRRRVIGLALTAIVIEVGLLAIAHFGPAFRVLLRPVYVIVATIFVWIIWRSARRRNDGDRRHGERRSSAG